MFGKKPQVHIHRHEGGHTTVNENVRLEEHRAPTDESVKLLREMEDKAREQVIWSYHTALDNDIHGTVVVVADPKSTDTIAEIMFTLNGVKSRTRVRLTAQELQADPAVIGRQLLSERLAEGIAGMLVHRMERGAL